MKSFRYAHSETDRNLDNIHQILQSLRLNIPTTPIPPIPIRNPARSPASEAPNPLNLPQISDPPPNITPQGKSGFSSFLDSPHSPESAKRAESPDFSEAISSHTSPNHTRLTSRASSPTRKRISEFSFSNSSLRYSSSSYASSTVSSGGWSNPGTPRDSFINRNPLVSTKKPSTLPRTPELREPSWSSGSDRHPLLPPPALGHISPTQLERATSQSILSPYPSTQSDLLKLHRSSTTSSQRSAFEKEAFRNSAILCDV